MRCLWRRLVQRQPMPQGLQSQVRWQRQIQRWWQVHAEKVYIIQTGPQPATTRRKRLSPTSSPSLHRWFMRFVLQRCRGLIEWEGGHRHSLSENMRGFELVGRLQSIAPATSSSLQNGAVVRGFPVRQRCANAGKGPSLYAGRFWRAFDVDWRKRNCNKHSFVGFKRFSS